MRFTKITIIRKRELSNPDINDELQWFGASLGLFNLRDKDSSCFRVFITLVKSLKAKQGMTSDEIAAATRLSRGTVVHHLNKLMQAGIVGMERNTYFLVVESLEELVALVQDNLTRTMKNLHDVARNIDSRLGL